MTLQAEAAKADAAERYKVAAITSDQKYWDNRRAEHAASVASDATAQLPVVIVDGRQVDPGSPVPVPQQQHAPVQSPVVQTHAVATQRPPEMPMSGTWLTAAETLEGWRKDGTGYAALERWPSAADDLPYGLPVMAGILDRLSLDRQAAFKGIIAELGRGFEVELAQAASAYARQLAPQAGNPASLAANPSPPKGPTVPTYEFKSDAEMKARYAALTPLIHRARARGDHAEYYSLAAEREALGQRVHPGDGSPDAAQRGHQVG